MLITLTRTNKSADGIFGSLALDADSFKCVTMENLANAVVAGTYSVKWMFSEHFSQIMPFMVIPNRIACELHWANFPKQLEGCVALGTSLDIADDAIGESRVAWKLFIKAVLNQPNLTIKIIEDYGNAQSV